MERSNPFNLPSEKNQPRYRLLETIRQYGWEKLVETGEGEESEVLRKHLSWCLQMVQEGIPKSGRSRPEKPWLALLELEHNNFRAALGWSIDQMKVQAVKRLEAPEGT